MVRVAVAQLRSTCDKVSNLIQVAKCAGWARRHGATLLFLPECFGFIGSNSRETVQHAETTPLVEVGTSISTHNNNNKMEWLESIVDQCAKGDTTTTTTAEEEKEALPLTPTTTPPSPPPNDTIDLLQALATIARCSGLTISAGGLHEGGNVAPCHSKSGEARVYNTHVIVSCGDKSDDKDKKDKKKIVLAAAYRKIHLFDFQHWKESASTAPGSQVVACPLLQHQEEEEEEEEEVVLGLSTCYDVRFPELYTQLVMDCNATILLVPAAFTVVTGRAHWHSLLRARAIETQSFVIAAAQVGRHNNEGRESYGHSLVVDPWGTILADAGGYDGPGHGGVIMVGDNHHPTMTMTNPNEMAPRVVVCDLDMTLVQKVRNGMPIQQHRKAALHCFKH